MHCQGYFENTLLALVHMSIKTLSVGSACFVSFSIEGRTSCWANQFLLKKQKLYTRKVFAYLFGFFASLTVLAYDKTYDEIDKIFKMSQNCACQSFFFY